MIFVSFQELFESFLMDIQREKFAQFSAWGTKLVCISNC